MTSIQQMVYGLSCRGMSCNTVRFLYHLFFVALESGHLLHLLNDNINHRSNSIQMSSYDLPIVPVVSLFIKQISHYHDEGLPASPVIVPNMLTL